MSGNIPLAFGGFFRPCDDLPILYNYRAGRGIPFFWRHLPNRYRYPYKKIIIVHHYSFLKIKEGNYNIAVIFYVLINIDGLNLQNLPRAFYKLAAHTS